MPMACVACVAISFRLLLDTTPQTLVEIGEQTTWPNLPFNDSRDALVIAKDSHVNLQEWGWFGQDF